VDCGLAKPAAHPADPRIGQGESPHEGRSARPVGLPSASLKAVVGALRGLASNTLL